MLLQVMMMMMMNDDNDDHGPGDKYPDGDRHGCATIVKKKGKRYHDRSTPTIVKTKIGNAVRIMILTLMLSMPLID